MNPESKELESEVQQFRALSDQFAKENTELKVQLRDSAAVAEAYIKRSAELESLLKKCHARIEKQAKALEEAYREPRVQAQKLADYDRICQIADARFQELVAKDRRIADLESELKRLQPVKTQHPDWVAAPRYCARYYQDSQGQWRMEVVNGPAPASLDPDLAQAYRRIQELASKNEELVEQLERQANQAEHFLDVRVNVEQALYPEPRDKK